MAPYTSYTSHHFCLKPARAWFGLLVFTSFALIASGGSGLVGGETRIASSDGTSRDSFGYSVGFSGNFVLVGAPSASPNGYASGGVFLYDMRDWRELKIFASDANWGDLFGISVAGSEGIIAVGAAGADDLGGDSGSAYLFRSGQNGVWVEDKFLATDGAAGDWFGRSVGLTDGGFVVGAPMADGAGTNSGSVYVFGANGSNSWTETKISPEDAAAHDRFGYSVATHQNSFLVGAPRDSLNGARSGSAYLYVDDGNGGWNETKFFPSDGSSDDWFGASVAMDGENIVIGAPHDDDGGPNSGAIYWYRPGIEGQWREIKITADDAREYDFYGSSVAMDGQWVVVGAPLSDNEKTDSGSAYLYHLSRYHNVKETKIVASDATSRDWYGRSVSILGANIVVGADYPGSGNRDGAYHYNLAFDSDGDCIDDYSELQGGSDPHDPSSIPTPLGNTPPHGEAVGLCHFLEQDLA